MPDLLSEKKQEDSPHYLQVLLNTVNTYSELEENDKARELYQLALKINPEKVEKFNFSGNIVPGEGGKAAEVVDGGLGFSLQRIDAAKTILGRATRFKRHRPIFTAWTVRRAQ